MSVECSQQQESSAISGHEQAIGAHAIGVLVGAQTILAAAEEHHVLGVVEVLAACGHGRTQTDLMQRTSAVTTRGQDEKRDIGCTIVMIDRPHAVVPVDEEVLGNQIVLL
eukprot:SAG31_NODE_6286_length_2084_cov_1.593451_2_plen_110_part_00